MSKREAEQLIRDIWEKKGQVEKSQPPPEPGCPASPISLEQFTYAFLHDKFYAMPRFAVETAYNLIHTLHLHSYDADCNLFLRIFTGEVGEDTIQQQQALLSAVLKAMRDEDLRKHQKVR